MAFDGALDLIATFVFDADNTLPSRVNDKGGARVQGAVKGHV